MENIFKRPLSELKHLPGGFISFIVDNSWNNFYNCGYANGYVGVPETSNFFGYEWSEIEDIIKIHGGLTFSREMQYEGKNYWVFGFDTGHAGDNQTNCGKEYVLAETGLLYAQLATTPFFPYTTWYQHKDNLPHPMKRDTTKVSITTIAAATKDPTVAGILVVQLKRFGPLKSLFHIVFSYGTFNNLL